MFKWIMRAKYLNVHKVSKNIDLTKLKNNELNSKCNRNEALRVILSSEQLVNSELQILSGSWPKNPYGVTDWLAPVVHFV